LFGTGGGQALADEIGAPLLGQVPIESSVAEGGDTGEPVSLVGTGLAADAFRAIATLIVTETVPPVQMADCSARTFSESEVSLRPRTK
jgi:ATP-binding protein involved in chromosome partitioning